MLKARHRELQNLLSIAVSRRSILCHGWPVAPSFSFVLHVEISYGKSPFLVGKLTISMAMFNSYVKLPEGIERASLKVSWKLQRNISESHGSSNLSSSESSFFKQPETHAEQIVSIFQVLGIKKGIHIHKSQHFLTGFTGSPGGIHMSPPRRCIRWDETKEITIYIYNNIYI